ncbi:39S ribosomal protein L55, mitochondrial [Chelonus insularis]|uniref:39S ribosomal protein L55, mitochondrial n=1 Tax=Chelonus insularis TaxID=460826 RepID=UPI00158E5E75|nr:39S ribosomal protein L55, mitochondrial [Chelonus insularis]
MKIKLFMLLEAIQPNFIPSRKFNCWTAAITKTHRKVYERMYPTILVFPDGSSINIEYHIPRKIITLPLNFKLLSDEEKKLVLERRKPKQKVKIEEDLEDDGFNVSKYLNLVKKK